jgi:methylenetetrahydrofolate dehydrogenase (NADP+)/methenyltetrahydrofolate cyclohydrolase
LIVAAGVQALVNVDFVRQGATVIDVGIHRTDDGLRGDVDIRKRCRPRGAHIARAGRGGPDDDRDADAQHPPIGAASRL